MTEDLVQMRLARSDRYRVVAEWEAHVDTRDGKAMRAALIGAVKGQVGEDEADWKPALPLHELLWRWGPSCGWRTFRAAK
ncbi:MAG: hypothetical protein L0I24_25060 [Pseudonocardia sp.]|nr:hypothetical protein [Pseudonocardia sp.]